MAAVVCALWLWPAPPAASAAEPPDVFSRFTAHISRQIQSDKLSFIEAEACTHWFYRQQRKPKPRPQAQGVAWPARPALGGLVDDTECATRYPGGLDAAREGFSRAQGLLSLSLTFYEFALVADRDDDDQYSAAELRDIMDSFGLSFDSAGPSAGHAKLLNTKFDALRETLGLDRLMESMGALYEKGYRLSSRDQAALSRFSR